MKGKVRQRGHDIVGKMEGQMDDVRADDGNRGHRES